MDNQASPSVDATLSGIGTASSIIPQLALIGMSVNAQIGEAWLNGFEASMRILGRAHGASGNPVVSVPVDAEGWAAFGRNAWSLAITPWRVWLPLLHIELP